jgi:hypothetical protein
MHRKNSVIVFVLLLSAALASACGDVSPAAPSPTLSSVVASINAPSSLSERASQKAVGGMANGRAELQGTPVQNVRDEQYSFVAVREGDAPLAKGQVEVHWIRFTGEELMAHAEVTCLSVVGNQAWIGARVTKLVQNGEDFPPAGRSMIFRVQDNGDDAAATDLATLVFMDVTPGRDLTYCNTREQFPTTLRPTTTGNIQVKP